MCLNQVAGCIITKLHHEVISKQQYMFNDFGMNSEFVNSKRTSNFYRVIPRSLHLSIVHRLLLAAGESIVLLENPLEAIHASLQGLELQM
jgi:hypothetical protein